MAQTTETGFMAPGFQANLRKTGGSNGGFEFCPHLAGNFFSGSWRPRLHCESDVAVRAKPQ